MKLCSIIMPTRGPHESLRRAVKSIKDTCTNVGDIEILLKVDDDDGERFFIAEELTKGCGSFVIAPRRDAYISMGLHVQDLINIADSRWVFLFDDDAWIEGDWYTPLYWMPVDCAVNCQYYCLGGSRYQNGPTGGPVGLLIPTELAKTIPHRNPVDQQWLDVVMQKGWKVKQLTDCTYWHDGRAR